MGSRVVWEPQAPRMDPHFVKFIVLLDGSEFVFRPSPCLRKASGRGGGGLALLAQFL